MYLLLLIAPEGIEIELEKRGYTIKKTLLIAPEGIEITDV